MQKTNVYTIPKTYRPITKPILVAPRNDSSLWWPHTLSKTNEKLKLKQTVLLKPSDTIIYSGWIYIQFVIQFHFSMTYCYIYNEIIDSNTQSYSWFLEKYSLSLSLHASRKHNIQDGRTKFSRHYINERYVKFSDSVFGHPCPNQPKTRV